MIELDELRELAADINSTEIIDHLDVVGKFMFHSEWLDSWHKAFDAASDAIEQVIAERYIELPVDAEGKPWHIGDRNESGEYVRAIGYKTIVYDFNEGDCDWAHMRTHEKPETIEDVLREACGAYHALMIESMSDVPHDMPAPSEIIAEYVERIERLVER